MTRSHVCTSQHSLTQWLNIEKYSGQTVLVTSTSSHSHQNHYSSHPLPNPPKAPQHNPDRLLYRTHQDKLKPLRVARQPSRWSSRFQMGSSRFQPIGSLNLRSCHLAPRPHWVRPVVWSVVRIWVCEMAMRIDLGTESPSCRSRWKRIWALCQSRGTHSYSCKSLRLPRLELWELRSTLRVLSWDFVNFLPKE